MSEYDRYEEWKGWSEGDRDGAAVEFSRLDIDFGHIDFNGKTVLEIGCGNGYFLSWAKSKGAILVATELNDTLVGRAKENGFEVYEGNFDEIAGTTDKAVDFVVALDVFEHIEMSKLRVWFEIFGKNIKSGGMLLARFPNGQSPFGRAFQNGDATHVTALGGDIIEQISFNHGFEIEAVKNSARTYRGGLVTKILRFFAYRLRDVIEIVLSNIYYGKRLPFDPNLTVILRKTS